MKSKLFGHGANDLYWFILPLVLPALLSRYNLGYTGAGGILTIYLLFTAAGSFVMGRLSDRMSRKKIISGGFFLSAAGLISAGFAPVLSVFLILMSVTAIGVSSFHPVMYAVIEESYPENKGRILGLYECFGTASILLMYLINGFLLSRIGVRGVLVITALPSVVMGLWFGLSDAVREAEETAETPAGKEPEPSAAEGSSRLILFFITVVLRVLSVSALLNFLPTVFVHEYGLGSGPAAYSTAFYFAGGMAGSVLFGRISGRFNSFAIVLGGTVFTGLAMLVLAAELPVWIYIVTVTIFGAAASGCIINQNLLTARLGRSLGKGQIFGILMGVSTLTSALSPALFGFIIDGIGYRDALYVFTAPLFVSALILVRMLSADRAPEADAAVPV